jgi:hypothetical protein
VQYHPEASPGPHDSRYLFQRFVDMMEKHRNTKVTTDEHGLTRIKAGKEATARKIVQEAQ